MANTVIYPQNPSIGDEFTVGGTRKRWDGTRWRNISFGNHETRLVRQESSIYGLISCLGFNLKGWFEQGVTFENENDVAFYDINSGVLYKYVGASPYPISVPAGYDPSADTNYEVVEVFDKIAQTVDTVANLVQLSPKVGQIVATKGYFTIQDQGNAYYTIFPAGTLADELIDFTLANGTVAKLNHKGIVSPEQIGYDGTNAGTVINNAFDKNIGVELLNKEYIVDTDILIRKNSYLVGQGDGYDKSVLQAADNLLTNVIDTLNYDALVSDNIVESEPVSGLACPTGFIIRNLTVSGNKRTYPGGFQSAVKGTGIGIRAYGKQFQINNVRIYKCANVGLITRLGVSGTYTVPYEFYRNSKAGSVQDVYIYDTGHENFIFYGPTDIWLNNIYAGASNDERTTTILDPAYDSVEEPGIGAHGVLILRSVEIGWMHAFGNPQGYAFYCEGDAVNLITVRLRFQYLMGESAHGCVYIGNRTRATGNLLEVHANVFGDGSNALVDLSDANNSIKINNIDLYRDASERGATGVKVGASGPLTADIKFDYSGTWDTQGHGIEIDGYGHDIEVSGLSGGIGNAYDGTPSTGILFGSAFDNSRVSAQIRGYETGVKFNGNVSNSTLNLNIRNSVTTGYDGYSFLGEFTRLNSQLIEQNTASSGVTKRNKFKGYVEFDATISTQQTTTIAHNLIGTPLKRDVQLTPYYNTGSIGNSINKLWVNNADETNIEVGYHVDGTGSGLTRVGVLVL